MQTAVVVISLVLSFLAIWVASRKGLDLRRASSWLYGAISFLGGLALGFSLTSNLGVSLETGAIIAFLTLFTGVTLLRHNQRYRGMANSLLLRYGKEEDPSLFAILIRKLLGKYK